MRLLRTKRSTFALVLALGFGVGCDRSSAPPTPLPSAEFPAAFEKVFSKAKPETKDVVNQIVASVQAQDYSKAFLGLQTLASRPDLTKEQVSVTTRGLLTVNTLLQAAQAQGDAKAAETIKVYNSKK